MVTPLDVLLIESRPGEGASRAAELGAAGHRVHRCWATSPDDPTTGEQLLCRAVTHDDCPLDREIDVCVLVRGGDSSAPQPTEAGFSCAVRAGVPVVADGIDDLDPFAPYVAARCGDDVAETCAEAVERSYDPVVTALRTGVAHLLEAEGIDPGQVTVDFQVEHPTLHVLLRGPAAGPRLRQALSVRAADALRVHPRSYDSVDISYGEHASR